jgi:hypothetical protein
MFAGVDQKGVSLFCDILRVGHGSIPAEQQTSGEGSALSGCMLNNLFDVLIGICCQQAFGLAQRLEDSSQLG